MKKYFVLLALTGLALTACNNNGNNTPDPVGTTYPRVQLIEHFTGVDCGYCPMGMDQIYEVYSQNTDGYVWISNHTYYPDSYTIDGSNTVAKKLGVTGAPIISLNRVKHEGERVYHSYYIAEYAPGEATTATSMVHLDRTYNAATRELKITASGKTSDADIQGFKLTVAITESGMVGPQNDKVYAWEGWKKFTHTHAVRAYVSQPLGDNITLDNRMFTKEYTVNIDDKWVADNCEIVAWITKGETNWPVLNAAKLPVVDGTKGGEDIVHGGIELYPVPDYYPESGAPDAEVTFKKCEVYMERATGATLATMVATNLDSVVRKVSGTSMYPYAEITFLLEPGTTTIPAGTYNIVQPENAQIGDVVAGRRNDEEHAFDNSIYLWIYQSDGYLYMGEMWYMNSGTVVVTDSGFEFTVTSKNGNPIHGTFTGDFSYSQAAGAPARLPIRK